MSSQFPSKLFKQALVTSNRIKVELQPFLGQFKKNNMPWIVAALDQLFQYLHNPQVELNVAANVLFAVKFILDSSDLIMTNMIQLYLLPAITEIALCQIETAKEKRGHSYFISKGFTGDKSDLQYRGFNFVRIANELVLAASQIKPKKVCFNQQLDEPSEFQLALQKLKSKGFKPYSKFQFYRVSVAEIRNSFLKNLQAYPAELPPFKEYMLSFIRQYLIKGIEPSGHINLFKILEKGEATANQLVGRQCMESLKSKNLAQRKRALIVVSDLVRWGDIFIALHLNSQPTIEKVVREIEDSLQSNKRLERALVILNKYQNTDAEKQEYYVQLLKSLKFWSKCYPTAIQTFDKLSNLKYFCGKLENQGIEFPPYDNIFADEAIFESNRRKKQHLNERLLDHYQNTVVLKNANPAVIPILQISSSGQQLSNPFQQFKRQILKIRDILTNLFEEQKRLWQYVELLSQFQAIYDVKIVNKGDFTEHEMSFIVNEGAPLLQRIQNIMPFVEQYKHKKITFEQFKAIVVTKNKEITLSKEYTPPYKFQKSLQSDSQATSKKESDPSSSKNSLDRQLLNVSNESKLKRVTSFQFGAPTPIIKQTQSQQFMINAQTKSKRPVFKRPQSIVPDRDILALNFSTNALMNSVPHKHPQQQQRPDQQQHKEQRGQSNPNCLKLLNEFESIQAYKSIQGTTLKRIETQKQHILEKYDRAQSRISEKRYEDDRSDIMSSARDIAEISLFNQFQRDDGVIEKQVSEYIIEQPEEQELPPEIPRPPQIRHTPSSRMSFSQFDPESLAHSHIKTNNVIAEVEEEHSDQQLQRVVTVEKLQDSAFNPSHALSNHTVSDVIAQKPTSFLRYLSEDNDEIELKKKKSSLKLLRPEDLDIIKPIPTKPIHRRSQSDNVNEAFKEKKESYHKKDVVKKIYRLSDLLIPPSPTKIPHLNAKDSLLQQKEEDYSKAEYEISTGRQFTEEVEEDVNIFKDKFLNSRKKRSSLKKRSLPQLQHFQFKPQTVELDVKKSKGCFSNLQNEEDKRNQLRSKILLLKTDVLQIGCCVKHQNGQLTITYYFTPNQDLTHFRTHFGAEFCCLGISSDLPLPDYLPKYKQKKIKFKVNAPKVPFAIPTIQFSYKVNSNSYIHLYPLPCAYHKYFELQPIDQRQAAEFFKNGKQIVKSGLFSYSKKVLKEVQQLGEFFPRGVLLRGMGRKDKVECQFIGKVLQESSEWVVKMTVKSDQTMQLKISCEKTTRQLQFFLETIFHLLKREKQSLY